MTYRFEDPAAEFVLAVERIFGEHPRVLDGSRAVLVGDVKLQLEAGERELWLIETHGPLEHRLAMVAGAATTSRRRCARRRRSSMSSTEWELVCGLEVHAHLKTRTKMFCRCELEYGARREHAHVPVCLAHPGALPVPNARAIEMTILLGLALDCEIAERAVFARKNYFYPDLPKGYQISQYEAPLCGRARSSVPTADGDREIGIVRAHLEEDAAKTVHAGGATGRSVGADYSSSTSTAAARRCSRSSSAPDLRSADEAMSFLRLLRQTIVELGVSDAEMEKGTLRADVNVSVRERGEEGFRPRWEIKNMNSFTFIGRAIEAAFRAAGRGARGRGGARAVDVRLRPRHRPAHRAPLEGGGGRLPLLPRARPRPGRAAGGARRAAARRRSPSGPATGSGGSTAELGFAAADELVTTGNEAKAEALAARGRRLEDGRGHRDEPRRLPARERRRRSRRSCRRTSRARRSTRRSRRRPTARSRRTTYLARRRVGDESALAPVIDAVLAANPEQVETYRGGKEGVLGFLVGQVMKRDAGQGRPEGRQPASAGEASEARQVADRRAQRPDDRGDRRPARRARRSRRGDVCASSSPAASGPSGADAAAACSRPPSRARAAGRASARTSTPDRGVGVREPERVQRDADGEHVDARLDEERRRRRAPSRTPRAGSCASGRAAAAAATRSSPASSATP